MITVASSSQTLPSLCLRVNLKFATTPSCHLSSPAPPLLEGAVAECRKLNISMMTSLRRLQGAGREEPDTGVTFPAATVWSSECMAPANQRLGILAVMHFGAEEARSQAKDWSRVPFLCFQGSGQIPTHS